MLSWVARQFVEAGVRLGHATHSTPEQRQEMRPLGIIVEANVGSNLATGSILRVDEHPILQNIYDEVPTVLATDAQGVMSTTSPTSTVGQPR